MNVGLPQGCEQSEDCSYFLSLGVNPTNDSFVDFHLEGDLDGERVDEWVGVGFSLDKLMVRECVSLAS